MLNPHYNTARTGSKSSPKFATKLSADQKGTDEESCTKNLKGVMIQQNRQSESFGHQVISQNQKTSGSLSTRVLQNFLPIEGKQSVHTPSSFINRSAMLMHPSASAMLAQSDSRKIEGVQ